MHTEPGRRDVHGAEGPDGGRRECVKSSCGRAAAFWLYDGAADYWSPACDRHAEHVHPSIGLRAWLESGYLKPTELGEPDGPPSDPRDRRGTVFGDEIREAMGWSGETGPPGVGVLLVAGGIPTRRWGCRGRPKRARSWQ